MGLVGELAPVVRENCTDLDASRRADLPPSCNPAGTRDSVAIVT
jgi:hypothetical protein